MDGAALHRKCRLVIHSMRTGYRVVRPGCSACIELIGTSSFHSRKDLRIHGGMERDFSPEAVLDDCSGGTPDWTPVYDAFVAALRSGAVGASAPACGDSFPDFALPDEHGRYRTLASIVADGPIVLSFNRGGWCPFCRGELSAWGERADALAKTGGRFVTITGEVGGRAGRLHEIVGPDATIMCDIDHGLALSVGLAFRCGDDLQRRYRACGLDLADIYGGGGGLLPVPATFVIDRDLTVRYAFADPDFRNRADPDTVIAALVALR